MFSRRKGDERMSKKLDLSKSVYELTREYPELVGIMVDLGFTEITKKPMLHSVGKIMTIPKGAKMKNISMMDVVTTLMSKGFELVGDMPAVPAAQSAVNPAAKQEDHSDDRIAKLKGYLRRLGSGDDLEHVRADFVREFSDVEASEIMNAEQELLKEGAPLSEVQKLCDVHSALFHGATTEERIANAEKAVEESVLRQQMNRKLKEMQGAEQEQKTSAGLHLQEIQAAKPEQKTSAGLHLQEIQAAKPEQKTSAGLYLQGMHQGQLSEDAAARQKVQEALARRDSFPKKDYTDKNERAAALEGIKGHPLEVLTKENNALSLLIQKYRDTHDESLLSSIRELSVHYAKKGDLLYPLLKVRYGISGPSDVMWTVDDEIRNELGELAKDDHHDEAWQARVDAVLKRAEEMIYKEQNILFPICSVNFTEEEWHGIYTDAKDYAECLGISRETWEEAEHAESAMSRLAEGEVVMPGGHMSVEQLAALLNTLPIEISFVDADNINRFFNEGPKVFKRPSMALDREVFACHPPKIEPMVRQILDDFRNNRRNEVPVWMEKNGRSMLVRYLAVRDKGGKYLGTVEVVQDMEFAKEHFLGNHE